MTDIIDNRREKICDFIRDKLPLSERAKFAVGYFFLSGFESIRRELKEIGELKLLIGNTSSQQTLDQLAEGYKRLEIVEKQTEQQKFAKAGRKRDMAAETSNSISESIGLMDQTDEAEELILDLASLIEQKKVKVKVYTKENLHAKTYIFDYRDKRYGKGIAVVGSSNLTLSGIQSNTELNVIVSGDENHQQLSDWFSELWEEAKDFDEYMMNVLKQSWAMNTPSPYDIYIKTLYSLIGDRLEGELGAEVIWDSRMPPLADFQKIAVRQALQILNDNEGVFIADVVGLGKTFIGSSLLKHLSLKRKRPLVICPPTLRNMWEEFCREYEIPAVVLSNGMLSRKEFQLLGDATYEDRDVVLIDESHHFRNRNTIRYKCIEPYMQGRQAIFLTATPRNTSCWDIYNQMKLFHPEDTTSLPIDPPSLLEFFKGVDEQRKQLPELLRHVLIRRTRKHVLQWYGEDDDQGKRFIMINGHPNYFPERLLETKTYSIESTYRGLYENITDLIKELTLSKYSLWKYVLKDKRDESPYKELKKSWLQLRGLIRVLLLKRFESSVFAFQKSVNNMLEIHKLFLDSMEKGFIPAGEEAQKLIYDSDRDEEDSLMEALELVSRKYQIDDFEAEKLKDDLEADIQIFSDMWELVKDIRPSEDDKLRVLKELLHHYEDQKILIFTQYADTARYLQKNLSEYSNMLKVDSDTKNLLSVVRRFAPKSNKYQLKPGESSINLLISTDVLSEGLNLQDASVVINYDLHWNPVRLIQRIGRLDRIGSQVETVNVLNFLPEMALEKRLKITDTLNNRIAEIHRTIGEDAQILDPREKINEKAMYAIYEGDVEAVEEMDESGDLFDLSEAEELVRGIRESEPNYFEYIKRLQDGVRCASGKKEARSFFVFCQARNYQGLYLFDNDGNIVSRDVTTALSAIKAAPDDEGYRPPKGHNVMVMKAKRDFEEHVKQLVAQQYASARLKPAQSYVIKELRLLFAKTEDVGTKDQINRFDEIFRLELYPAAISALNKLRKEAVAGEALLDRLNEIYFQFNLESLKERKRPEGDFSVRVICSEAIQQ